MRYRPQYIRSRKPIHGFTLIELLVVISIIALLLAIMVPALRLAREQAKKVVCKSQLRQFGLVHFMYSNNYGKYVDRIATSNNPHPWGIYSWPHSWDIQQGGGRAFYNLVKDATIFFCPANNAKRSEDEESLNDQWIFSTYAYCFGNAKNPVWISVPPVTRKTSSGSLPLMLDMTVRRADNVTYLANHNISYSSQKPPKTCNVLHVDGHISDYGSATTIWWGVGDVWLWPTEIDNIVN